MALVRSSTLGLCFCLPFEDEPSPSGSSRTRFDGVGLMNEDSDVCIELIELIAQFKKGEAGGGVSREGRGTRDEINY